MTATRTFAKKGKIFRKKNVREGKKVENAALRFERIRRAFSPNTAARTVPDWRRIPCCASLATRRPRPQKADVRGAEPEKRDAVGVGVRGRNRTDRRAEQGVRRNASKRRFHYCRR